MCFLFFIANTNEPSDTVGQLLAIVQSPFRPYLLQYSQLQQTQLMSVIDSFSVVSRSIQGIQRIQPSRHTTSERRCMDVVLTF